MDGVAGTLSFAFASRGLSCACLCLPPPLPGFLMDTTSGAALFHPLVPESTDGNQPVFRMEDLEANADFQTKVHCTARVPECASACTRAHACQPRIRPRPELV